MNNFDDNSLYLSGLKFFRENQLDKSLNNLISIKSKNQNTLKIISQI